MKKIRLTDFLPGKFYYLPLVFLSAACIVPGCQKSDSPCKDVVSEGQPTQVGLIFVDGQTGENILLSKNIDSATIKIIPESTELPPETGTIVKNSASAFYGSLVFHIADTKKGSFKYKISIPDVGTTTLSYINKEEKSNNKCKPYYISVTAPVIEDHPFTVSQINSRFVFRITL